MSKFYVFNETDEVIKEDEKILKKVLKFAINHENLKNVEFNVIFTTEDNIQKINKEYRGIDKVTDVISFALEDNETFEFDHRLLGDIYICLKRARGQAEEYQHSFTRELCFLAVHGFYHLLGYDHMNEDDEKIMFAKQEEVLKLCNIRR